MQMYPPKPRFQNPWPPGHRGGTGRACPDAGSLLAEPEPGVHHARTPHSHRTSRAARLGQLHPGAAFRKGEERGGDVFKGKKGSYLILNRCLEPLNSAAFF